MPGAPNFDAKQTAEFKEVRNNKNNLILKN
jgi:hypothetical protein